MDRETGRARGFAFVEMPNDAEAAAAMTASTEKSWRAQLEVNEARPKGEAAAARSTNFGGPAEEAADAARAAGRDRFSNEDYRESARQPANRAGSFPFPWMGWTAGPGLAHSAVRRGL